MHGSRKKTADERCESKDRRVAATIFRLPFFDFHFSSARCEDAAAAFGLRWDVDLRFSVLMEAATVVFRASAYSASSLSGLRLFSERSGSSSAENRGCSDLASLFL